MSSIIDFLRRQLFMILCAVGGVVGLVLIVTGYMAMPKVMSQMKQSESLYNGLMDIERKSANRRFIAQAERRIAEIKQVRDEVVGKAAALHRFVPLVEGVFPNGNKEKRMAFRDAYEQAMKELYVAMRAGEPPTSAEIKIWEDKIIEEKYQREQREKDPSQPPPPPIGAPYNEAGVLTPDGARIKAEERASIAKAQQIDIYAVRWEDVRAQDRDRVSSLHFDPAMRPRATLEAPTIEECWWAQVGYWIQKDVVDAIIAANKEAGQKLPDPKKDVWVVNLPVKELISIRVRPGFLGDTPDATAALAPAGGYSEALPPGSADLVFTHTTSSADVDVVQFTLKVVVDQREILKLVEKICSDRFYVNLRIDYRKVPPNRLMKGKIYGPAPVVNAVMDFEAIMVGRGVGEGDESYSEFRRLMPPSVCEEYGIDCPEHEEAGEDS